MAQRVLIVEDDPAFGDYLRRGLAYEGYESWLVTSAEAGLLACRTREPQIIILDLMLPGIDGLTACQALRRAGFAGPVLMLTARGGIGDRVAGLDSGADDYLPKPCEFDELLARLRAIQRRCPSSPSLLTYTAGDLCLDPKHFYARRGERLLALTRTEFALLAALLRPPVGVRTREALLTIVWGDGFQGADKVLDMTICRLRAKLGPPDPIRTLPGVGYRLVSPPGV